METLIAAGIGAGIGFGIWLIWSAVSGIKVIPDAQQIVPAAVPADRALVWLAAATGCGLLVGVVTGWPVAGVTAGLGLLLAPAALGGAKRRAGETQRAEAVATWADMIRDTMAGASGLEEALVQTSTVAPAPIRPELRAFSYRLRHQSFDDALSGLADDLNHPSADLLVAALAAAGRLEARDLGGLLARLAEAIRGDVRMRTRIDVGRARIRTSARIAVGTTVATIGFLYLFGRHLLEPYDTALGQAWLLVVAAVFFTAGWLLHRYSQLEAPERFTLRRVEKLEVPR